MSYSFITNLNNKLRDIANKLYINNIPIKYFQGNFSGAMHLITKNSISVIWNKLLPQFLIFHF